jgi:hypothetical protein
MSLVPDIVIIFQLDGERKQLSYRKIPFSGWSELKAALGFTPMTLGDAMISADLEAVGALIWLERKQRERDLRWPEVRRLLDREDHSLEVLGAIVDGEVVMGEDDTPGREPDPTKPNS